MNTEIKKEIIRGTIDVVPVKELEKKLALKRPLIIKLGMDPTAPDLHLGHAVVLRKLKQFQDLGHQVVFLIGNFTAAIGDPTGKSKTRPALTQEVIQKNTQTYFQQVGRILDTSKVKIVYNSEWLKKVDSQEFVSLCSKVTLARLIEREDFKNRLEKNQSIGFHELLYPLMQGYDSVVLNADVELGGTDQTFNLLMGRFLQEQYGQEPQVVITTPLLEGLDGIQKMSKSLGNYIGLIEPAKKAFGKLMSISDTLMWRYAHILLHWSEQKIEEKQAEHPMDVKKEIAKEIIADFWSSKEAEEAAQHFESVFQKKDFSKGQKVKINTSLTNPAWIVDLLKSIKAVDSSSQAKRLIEAGSVSINENKITNFKAQVEHQEGMTIKVGKHKVYVLSL